jgi:nucleotide-binding universal stress UspA family protein
MTAAAAAAATTTTTTTTSTIDFSSNTPQYKKILVPHDSSQMSDKALAHAVYISKITGAHIEMLHIIDLTRDILSPSTLLAVIGPDRPVEKAKEDLKNMAEAGVRKILEERVKICKEEGKIEQVSYKIEIGKPVNEIVRITEENGYDLIVMASSRISSSVRLLGSTTKGVIDSIRKPVLIIHE